MAVFYDLDDDDCPSRSRPGTDLGSAQRGIRPTSPGYQLNLVDVGGSDRTDRSGVAGEVPVHSLTANKVAAALTCYPYALAVVLEESGH